MAQIDETFFTAVGCMDGRVQEVIARFGQEKFGVLYPDTITEAGIVKPLAQKNIDQTFLESVRFKVIDVSLLKHHSKGIIVHGHQECAGNPVSDEQQKSDILLAASTLRSLLPAENTVAVVPVFVKQNSQGKWEIEELQN